MSNSRLKESISEALNFDSLHEAEKITGKDYHDDKETSSLGLMFHLNATKNKRDLLASVGDSHYGTTFSEMVLIAESLGFEKVYEEKFQGRDTEETYVLMWDPRGVLARFETYNGESLNAANINFNLRFDTEQQLHEFWGKGHSSGKFNNDHDCWVGTLDVREAFKYYYEYYLSLGNFVPVWVESPWLYINAYTDYYPPYDLSDPVTSKGPHQKNMDRLRKLPDHVQKAIAVAIKE